MDLLCRELVILNDCDLSNNNNRTTVTQMENISNQRVNTAIDDPIFLDDRCLQNLLKTEDKFITSYFKTVQNDITPNMRKVVTEWMIGVCEERNCQEEVFLLALNYMDRFLTTTTVRKTHLQILAAACLLLASKLREPSCLGLPADLLVYYTDNSISKCDLINWELIVLSRLKWNVSSVTPLDFLDLLLSRLPIDEKRCPDINLEKVRKNAQAFISLAAREHQFLKYSPSTIAAASIAASINGLHWHLRIDLPTRFLLEKLTEITRVKLDYLKACLKKMEDLFDHHRQYLTNLLENCNKSDQSTNNLLQISHTPEKGKVKTGTPTDVRDVDF